MKDELADTYLTHTDTFKKKDWTAGIATLNNSLLRIIPDLMLGHRPAIIKAAK